MKTIINDNEKGLLFDRGRFVKVLESGRYTLLFNKRIEVLKENEEIVSAFSTLEKLLKNETFEKKTVMVEVADSELALHFVDGKFSNVLTRGKHAFWNGGGEHSFKRIDISETEATGVPGYIFAEIPGTLFTKIEVAEYQKARLFFDNKLVRLLDAGTYYFWKNGVKVSVSYVDTRLVSLNVTGQEILTADKVSLRINLVCNYKVADYIKTLTEIDNYEEQLHVALQLAVREYVGKYRLDEILANKEEISRYVSEKIKRKENEFFINVIGADVKDIVLPGEIRDIMNTVLVAEKKAQANVIARREEVASTRSLLNTAKLMEENKTLYKLKELEYVERICENVGSIHLNGNADILAQLAELLGRKEVKER